MYMRDVDTLLRFPTEQDFLNRYDKLSRAWCPNYVEYFEQNIKLEIVKHSGRWILEENDIYNPYSGVHFGRLHQHHQMGQ